MSGAGERIESAGYRYTVPGLFADADGVEAFCSELLELSQAGENEGLLRPEEEYCTHSIRSRHELGAPEREG